MLPEFPLNIFWLTNPEMVNEVSAIQVVDFVNQRTIGQTKGQDKMPIEIIRADLVDGGKAYLPQKSDPRLYGM